MDPYRGITPPPHINGSGYPPSFPPPPMDMYQQPYHHSGLSPVQKKRKTINVIPTSRRGSANGNGVFEPYGQETMHNYNDSSSGPSYGSTRSHPHQQHRPPYPEDSPPYQPHAVYPVLDQQSDQYSSSMTLKRKLKTEDQDWSSTGKRNGEKTPIASAPTPIIPPWDDKEGHYIVVPLEDLTPRYKIIRLLGQGTFGKVVECYDRETGRHCAIKVIRAVQKYRDASKIEARVLSTLKKSDPKNTYNCLHLMEIFDFRNHVCMVFELLGQSIYDWLKDNYFCPFPPNQIQQFAKQLLTSVAFLHRLRLIHTDLKPENILLANGSFRQVPYKTTQKGPAKMKKILTSPEIRLIDFGSATFQEEHHSTVVSTRHYRAPEIILEHLAMMQAVLGHIPDKLIRASHKTAQKFFVQGRLDYPNEETKRNSRKFVKALRPLRNYVVPAGNTVDQQDFATEFLDLLSRLLAYDPSDRITAAQALRHPYFNYIVDEHGQIRGVRRPYGAYGH
ncbi:dual specificity protein kinase kns1 [Gryganskiella cystojenkinii]|nr:dual specificity protein kinase kns1 [Gryganskiella cystojenkinii]